MGGDGGGGVIFEIFLVGEGYYERQKGRLFRTGKLNVRFLCIYTVARAGSILIFPALSTDGEGVVWRLMGPVGQRWMEE